MFTPQRFRQIVDLLKDIESPMEVEGVALPNGDLTAPPKASAADLPALPTATASSATASSDDQPNDEDGKPTKQDVSSD